MVTREKQRRWCVMLWSQLWLRSIYGNNTNRVIPSHTIRHLHSDLKLLHTAPLRSSTTVNNSCFVLFFTSECIIVRLSVSYICQRGVLQLHVGAEKSKNQTHSIQSFFNICSIKVIISVVLLCRCTNRRSQCKSAQQYTLFAFHCISALL